MRGRDVATGCVLIVLLSAMAGCLSEPPVTAPEEPTPEPRVPAPTEARVHGPRADGNLSDGLAELLPGIPLPLGEARYTGGFGFEPTLGVTGEGVIFMSSLPAASELYDEVTLLRSRDQGATWEDVTPRIAGPTAFNPLSFDPYTHVDVDTGRVFDQQLGPLACATLAMSDDDGESWIFNPIGCGHPVAPHDHQTIWTGKPRITPTAAYPNLVYYCVNRLVDSACAVSANGGLSFGPLRPLVYGDGQCGGLHAHGASAPDGTAYLPTGSCGYPEVAISEDDGLTWEVVTISSTVGANDHEVAMAIDEAGNAYAFWIGTDRLPYLAASTDGGRSWAEPLLVSPEEVGTAGFPTVAAGAEGRIAVAYVGTQASKPYGDMTGNDTWNAYITVVLDAHTDAPLLATMSVNDPSDPIGRGNCGGSRCTASGGGALGDFIDIVIDTEGRPWAAFVDACTVECAAPSGNENDFGLGLVGTTTTGPALRGTLAPLTALAPLAATEATG